MISKQVIWRFRICYYFPEIFKYHDVYEHFKKFLEIFFFARIVAKFKYLAKNLY